MTKIYEGELSKIVSTHLGWDIQAGWDKEAHRFFVLVNEVHYKSLPVSGTVTADLPDFC